MSSKLKPTKFTIGEMGDFFRSQRYFERRKFWAEFLYELCEMVKIRTMETNYAGPLASLEFLYERFPAIFTTHGIRWEVSKNN